MIEYLDWDSNFFKKRIGKIYYTDTPEIADISLVLEQAKSDNYQLIYCFGNENLLIEEEILKKYGGKLVDRKIIFTGNTKTTGTKNQSIKEYIDFEVNDSLLDLAYLSGEYSRYKLDSNFEEKDFKRLYQTWVENSITKKIADKTFVAYLNNNIVGFVTVKKKEGYGQIGLIATCESVQGKGLGRELINTVKQYLSKENIHTLEVATQTDNTGACNFYKKCGLTEKSISNIYHFWL